jgi:hypothetical protein
VSFATITLCVASQVFVVFVYFIVDSVWKLLDIPSYSTGEGHKTIDEFLPVSIWNVLHLRFKAVSVVSLVTAITKQQFVLIVSTVAELAVLYCNKRIS